MSRKPISIIDADLATMREALDDIRVYLQNMEGDYPQLQYQTAAHFIFGLNLALEKLQYTLELEGRRREDCATVARAVQDALTESGFDPTNATINIHL